MDLILFMLGGLGAIASIVWMVVSLLKKDFDKRAIVGLAASLVVFFISLGTPANSSKETVENDSDGDEVVVEKEKKTFAETGDGSDWDDSKGEIIGVSNKDFSDISSPKPSSVRGDDSGKWKKVIISSAIDVEDYAVSYYDMNMTEDQVHYIIDFGRNTTTSINYMSGLLYVDVMEYTKKEEHDLNKIGSGMLLQSFRIYPDGDIEKIDINS